MENDLNNGLLGSSLYLFAANTKFRKIVRKIVIHRAFEFFIIVMIIISSIILALDDPLSNVVNETIYNIDVFIWVVFMIEAALKIIAYGFIINGEPSYLR